MSEGHDQTTNIMIDYAIQQLTAIQQEIQDLLKKQTRLQIKDLKGTISDEEKIELAGIDKLLNEARGVANHYAEFIKLTIDEPPESKSFSDADRHWIQAVTGVNTAYRKWTGYVIDETVRPGDDFKTAFERVGLEVTVMETNGLKKRELKGRTDYAVGLGKGMDMFDNTDPREVHLVAVLAKRAMRAEDLWQCVAQAVSLYKLLKDAGKANKANKRVCGILSDATRWQFVFIDEKGLLWQSELFIIDLRSYDQSNVLPVYRTVHHIVKCCHEACTSPAVSLNQCLQ
ncbi:hypothetical protein HDU76_010154 [Blyttiomyces sp. JEL0837]|nr:hypothetical protein HDU76_010154 [Blyttiomyces sp. JEL0837]